VLDFSMPYAEWHRSSASDSQSATEHSIVLCSMYMDSQLASVAREVGITSVLSKSNVGQVIRALKRDCTASHSANLEFDIAQLSVPTGRVTEHAILWQMAPLDGMEIAARLEKTNAL
jgi:hypothetical protein